VGVALVGVARHPIGSQAEEVDAIRRIADSNIFAEPWRYVTSGDRVQVCAGPLLGLEGLVLYLKNEVRVGVGGPSLQRSVAAELDLASIRPTAPRLHASTAA